MPTPLGHSLWSMSMYVFFRKKIEGLGTLKKDAWTIFICIMIGLYADLDFFFALFSQNPYNHRSVTHSLIAVLLVTLMGGYLLNKRNTIMRPFVLSFSLAFGHLFWDFFTKCDRIPFGTMILWPLSRRYYQTPLFIFPGFDWTSLQGLLSFNLVKQLLVELVVFAPLLVLSVFVKTIRMPHR